MKLEIFKKQTYDFLIINTKSVSYFKINKTGEVIIGEKVETEIVKNNIFQTSNLENALALFIKKYNLSVLGIVLNLPYIIYQRISLPRAANPYEAILNYLKVSFPLSIEKYSFFYKEDKYQTAPTVSNFNLFFINKEIIDNILEIIEKNNIIPLFIIPSIEAIYQFLITKSLIHFDEEYIIFFIEKDFLLVFLLKNLIIEKALIEEIDIENVDLNILLERFYNFFKANASKDAKVYFFSENPLPSKPSFITHQQTFFSFTPLEILVQGTATVFAKVFSDQEITDFLALKPYNAYFFNRLPSIILFLGFYLLLVFILVSGIFLVFNFKLKANISELSKEIKKVQITPGDEEQQINLLLENLKKIDLKILENFDKIKKLKDISNWESISLEAPEKITFSLRVSKDKLDELKSQIITTFPQAKLINEELINDNEVKLIYNF